MKKRLLSLFLIFTLVISLVHAAVPYKESLKIENFKIKQVQRSNDQLRVLVESKSSSNLKLLFKITSKKDTKTIFSNQLLKRFEANWFLITIDNYNELKRLEVNGYIDIDNKKIIYINSELTYSFTGKEPLIQPQITQIPQPIEQATTASSYSYIYVNGKLIERIDSSNNTVFFHTDNLGSIKLITDANGNKIEDNNYEPFGNSLSLSSNNNHKYTGKELDKSGLYYYGARYYDSNLGRFTQIDPSYNPSETPYAYVNNNPLNKVDPTGKRSHSSEELVKKLTDIYKRAKGWDRADLTRELRKVGYDVVNTGSNRGENYVVVDRAGNIVRELIPGSNALGRPVAVPENLRPESKGTLRQGILSKVLAHARKRAFGEVRFVNPISPYHIVSLATNFKEINNARKSGGSEAALIEASSQVGGYVGLSLGYFVGSGIGTLTGLALAWPSGGTIAPLTVPLCRGYAACVLAGFGNQLGRDITRQVIENRLNEDANRHNQNNIPPNLEPADVSTDTQLLNRYLGANP